MVPNVAAEAAASRDPTRIQKIIVSLVYYNGVWAWRYCEVLQTWGEAPDSLLLLFFSLSLSINTWLHG